jgi:hypothetical protein
VATRFVNPVPVPESVGWRYAATLTDEAGAVISVASFASLTMRIYCLNALLTSIEPPIGTDPAVSILNAGRGTLDVNGLLTLTFLPSDSDMVDPTSTEESHVALIEGVYAGTRKFAHEIRWRVINLAKRPSP